MSTWLIVKDCVPAAFLAHPAEMICVILRLLLVYLLCSRSDEGFYNYLFLVGMILKIRSQYPTDVDWSIHTTYIHIQWYVEYILYNDKKDCGKTVFVWLLVIVSLFAVNGRLLVSTVFVRYVRYMPISNKSLLKAEVCNLHKNNVLSYRLLSLCPDSSTGDR